MRLCELTKIVPIYKPQDAGSGITGDSVCVKDYGHATFILTFGADVDGDSVLTLKQGATDGANTAALAFDMAYTSTDIGSDGAETLGALANDSDGSLTLTEATYENRMLVIEVDCKTMTDGYDWIDLRLSSAATAGTSSCVCILSEPRYGSDIGPTVLS
jgi:hypothetical protein